MPDRSRIPAAPKAFHPYLLNTQKYLRETRPDPPPTPNWQRLGLTLQNADDWQQKHDYWLDTLHKKYTDPERRTKGVNLEVRNFIAGFRDFARPLLNIMAASPNAIEEDEAIFNFRRERRKPSRVREPITEQCIAFVKPIGGGRVMVSCRTDHDTGRASLAARADSVLFAFKIGGAAPQHSNDGTMMVARRQARFDYDFGVQSAGNLIHIFFCWNDTKRPELKGPWSTVESLHVY